MDFGAHLARTDATMLTHLGGPVTYTPGAGAAVDVRGIFDALYVNVEAGEAGVSSCGPAVFLRLVDLPSDPRTDPAARVTVAGVAYRPHTIEPDGQGGVRLLLHLD